MCDSGISSNELQVICQQWGNYSKGDKLNISFFYCFTSNFLGGVIIYDQPFGLASGPVFLEFSGSRCDGTETALLECDYRPLSLTTSTCSSHANDVAVVCPSML